jgi:GNAT superfamily N-acetyltransferase
MHAQCSPVTVQRRYLSPLPVMTTKLASALLSPRGGFSLVAERRGDLAGVITVAAYDADTDDHHPREADVGLLVADSWQRQGIGTALLLAAVRKSPEAGFDELRLTVHPDNKAVLPMLSSAGLRARISLRDGYTQIMLPLLSRRLPG